MIDSEIVIDGEGSRTVLKLTRPAGGSRREARARRPRLSRRGPPCSCWRASSCVPRTGSSSSQRPTWSSRCARRSRPTSSARARWSCPGASCSRSPVASGRRRLDRAAARGAVCHGRRRIRELPAAHVLGRGLPAAAGVDAVQLHAIDRDALIETVARVGRSASRDESRPVLTGHPRAVRAGEGRNGRDRLLPARGQGDAVAGELPELEAIIPARALQELSRIAAGGGRDPARRAGEPRGLRRRRRPGSRRAGSTASSRTTASCSRSSSSTSSRSPREELLDVVRRVSLLAQRNSPLRLRFARRRADGVRADAGRRRGTRVACRRRYAADAMEIGFNADFLRDGLESVEADTVR